MVTDEEIVEDPELIFYLIADLLTEIRDKLDAIEKKL
jgi:hypothetical protein